MLNVHRFAQIAIAAILIGCSREPQPSAAQNRPPGSSGCPRFRRTVPHIFRAGQLVADGRGSDPIGSD